MAGICEGKLYFYLEIQPTDLKLITKTMSNVEIAMFDIAFCIFQLAPMLNILWQCVWFKLSKIEGITQCVRSLLFVLKRYVCLLFVQLVIFDILQKCVIVM